MRSVINGAATFFMSLNKSNRFLGKFDYQFFSVMWGLVFNSGQKMALSAVYLAIY